MYSLKLSRFLRTREMVRGKNNRGESRVISTFPKIITKPVMTSAMEEKKKRKNCLSYKHVINATNTCPQYLGVTQRVCLFLARSEPSSACLAYSSISIFF